MFRVIDLLSLGATAWAATFDGEEFASVRVALWVLRGVDMLRRMGGRGGVKQTQPMVNSR